MLYHARDFQVAGVTVSVGSDGKSWRQVAVIRNAAPPQKPEPDAALALTAEVGKTARYVRFSVRKAEGAKRVLIGEILVLAPAGAPRPEARPAVRCRTTPLHLKRTLDEALLEAGVTFLLGCYVTDVLGDEAGTPCGIVMANRAGRQAVLGKVIIDATPRATAARLAGAEFRPFPPGTKTFRRVVIGGEARKGKDLTARQLPGMRLTRTIRAKAGRRRVSVPVAVTEYTLRLPLADSSYGSLARAESAARDMTYHPDQLWASEWVFWVPPDAMKARAEVTGDWPGAEKVGLEAFRPGGVDRLYVLGGCAGVPRERAEKLLSPLGQIDLGARVGAAAAAEAKALPAPKGARLVGAPAGPAQAGEVRELLTGVRPIGKPPTIPAEARPLPVLGKYDVVVIGGGTSGAPAGIGAARGGAKTLVVEFQYALGGVGTLGAIAKYYGGYRGGFTREVDAAVGRGSWPIPRKMEWWRRALGKAGADVWFGCLGCGAVVAEGRVTGVVVATPHGRGVVLAKTVIDSTGAADIAAAAGAPTRYVDATDIAVQGTGLPPLRLNAGYTNTDFTMTDETDIVDVTHLFIYTRAKYGRSWDAGQLIDTRERRRIVGESTLTILDQVMGRTYPDTIAQSRTNYDTHGYTTDPFFLLSHPGTCRPYTPYRSLLPRGLDGLIVTGLGVGAHRDAIPFLRMQPDLQNQGYAAGAAAALAAKKNGQTRRIDVRALQRHLVEIGCVPQSVLAEEDSCPLPAERIARAVAGLAPQDTKRPPAREAAIVLAHPAEALPLLRKAWADAADGREKLTYALALAVLGDAGGLETLIAAVQEAPQWDKGWRYRGMGQFGANMSPLDRLICAIGRTRDPRAVPPILAKVRLLDAGKEFSHHRAVALALERVGDPAAAGPLAEVLAKPGMTGYAIQTIQAALERMRCGTDTSTRRDALRELYLARALYRCGDKAGVGEKILSEYARDLRGHFARHAHAVLRAGPRPLPQQPHPGGPGR